MPHLSLIKNSLKVLCVYKLSKKITKFVLILSRPLSKFHWIQQNRENKAGCKKNSGANDTDQMIDRKSAMLWL